MPDFDDHKESALPSTFPPEFNRLRLFRLAVVLLVQCFLFACLGGLFVAFYLTPPVRGILHTQEQIMAAQLQGMQKIPDLEKKLHNIENQINLLTTTSVDARLTALEKSLNSANLKPDEIADLNQLRSDLKSLKTFMLSDPREVVEFKEMQKDYHNLSANQSQLATRDALQSNISRLEWALGLGFGITWLLIGILFTMYFGSWFRKRPPQPTKPATSPVIAAAESQPSEGDR